ncbi:dihydrofolate reductase family protein [Micromonospora sp. NPDC049044]|uniref:dihydrofolate reductase family protein n=1 Tax=unclassified Micromonospora TaxID=2617518 RepID=UPI0033C25ABE
MRKVVLAMQLSLDGYVARPGGELDWMWPTFTPETMADIIEAIKLTSTQVMGRVTYEAQSAHWPGSTDEVAPLVNAAEKIVFSRTLREPLGWSGARLATTDLATTIETLRATGDGDIALVGGSALARAATRAGLVDEYQLIVHPVALGEGLPLFDTPVSLHLRDQRRYSSGAMRLTYSR